MKIRVKFTKNGSMRFVGHLDLMRYFQKAMRRAGLDLAYTEGYHPHPVLSFAAPLGLGLTSDGEYMDVEVHHTDASTVSLEALNREMVEGVTVTEYVRLPDDAPAAMASVTAADYIVYYKHAETLTQSQIRDGIQSYYDQRDHIPICKKTKKSERMIDLRPLLYQFTPYEDAKGASTDDLCSDLATRRGFFLRVCTGSTDNIRPELVLEDFYAFLGLSYDPDNHQIHRLEIYSGEAGGFLPLYRMGEDIR